MRFLTLAAVAVLALAGVAAWVVEEEPDWYLRARYPLEYEQIIRGHATNHHLDPALLAAVVYVESRFDPNAESAAGAIGLMQLLPDTAKGIALRTGGDRFVVADLRDPEINVRYGSWYLDHLSGATTTSAPRSPRTTRARATSTSGCVGGGGSSSRRRATTWTR